ncbi:MAG: tetratricopeptide repeat protein [Gammaproteobacteria bacterium]|nr:tetratricopeptide repeat protein [Gammaproteobacteria bacterium]
MMRHSFPGLLFVVAVSIAGCAGLTTREPESLPVSDNSAVTALVSTARTELANGKLDAAAGSFERALRIEPRNPVLWQELAKLRLQQGQYQQAEGLAARSNGWAGDNKSLRAENWRIIGQARLKRGDYPGAQSAFDKAAQAN